MQLKGAFPVPLKFLKMLPLDAFSQTNYSMLCLLIA
jgi:hypothetical protein